MGKRLLVLVLAFVVAATVAGCGGGGGGSGSSGNAEKTLILGNIGWTENIAVSNLTKVIFEEDLGYKEVELKLLDVGLLFEGVGGGDLHAFQDVWMPNHKAQIAEVEDDVEHLDPWYEGQTSFGLAVPSYMDTQSLADLNESGATEIIGIEPGAPFMVQVDEEVIPAYNLNLELKAPGTAAMLAEVGRLYEDKERFVFMPWCPHTMCEEFDFRYLEDPKNAQGEFDQPARISTIVNKDLPEDDPVAYAFLKEFRMNQEELISLEDEIAKASDDPIKGSQAWLKDNRDVVQPAIDAAKQAQ
jgi:glycine betaine/proline transport system substrate-binding protein